MMISSQKVYEALSYYSAIGYKMIDTPIIIDKSISSLTKPTEVLDLHHSIDKVYIGSAEQGFIQQYVNGAVGEGKFMSLTPCYRDEQVLDSTHFKVFFEIRVNSYRPKRL